MSVSPVSAVSPLARMPFASPPARHLASWAAFHQFLFPDPTLPQRRWETDVARYLWNRGYDPESIKLALEHAETYGTFECCRELAFSEADRGACEAMLPECPHAEWASHERDVWATND